MKYLLGLLLAFNLNAAFAEAWHCRNYDVEVSCGDGKCLAADAHGFTPMDVYIDDAGKMSVGMYSGVWAGTGQVMHIENYLMLVGKDLAFSNEDDWVADFFITLDTKDNIALFKGMGFAMPMSCAAWQAPQK